MISILLGSAGREGSESEHEVVLSWEMHQVDSHLSQVGVELSCESIAAGDTGHSDGVEEVQVTVGLYGCHFMQ